MKCVAVIKQSLCPFTSLASLFPSFLSIFHQFLNSYFFFITFVLIIIPFSGVPSQVVASGLRPGPERSPQAFNGCIHNVRINGEPQDLNYQAAVGARPQGVEGKVWGRFKKQKTGLST